MRWFLIVGALMVSFASEDACKKAQPLVPGAEWKAVYYFKAESTPTPGFITLTPGSWAPNTLN